MPRAVFIGSTVRGRQLLFPAVTATKGPEVTGTSCRLVQPRREGDTQGVLGRAKEFIPDLCSVGLPPYSFIMSLTGQNHNW